MSDKKVAINPEKIEFSDDGHVVIKDKELAKQLQDEMAKKVGVMTPSLNIIC